MFLFSTDIDGTIYDGPETAALFLQFWNRLRSWETPPLLAYNTGRSLSDTQALIDRTDLPEPDFIISGVGTTIYDSRRNRSLENWQEELDQLWDFEEVKQITLDLAPGIEMQPEECQNPFKCSWLWRDKSQDEIGALQRSLDESGMAAQVVYSSSRDLDILPAAANKGNALRWLASQVGLAHDKVCVAGDSGNDASMFLVEDVYGILVSNSEEALSETLEGIDVFRSGLPCARGVVEGLEKRIESLRIPVR